MSKETVTLGNIDTDLLPIQINSLTAVQQLILDDVITTDNLSKDVNYDDLLKGINSTLNILRAIDVILELDHINDAIKKHTRLTQHITTKPA